MRGVSRGLSRNRSAANFTSIFWAYGNNSLDERLVQLVIVQRCNRMQYVRDADVQLGCGVVVLCLHWVNNDYYDMPVYMAQATVTKV